jgi:hypothetical protein
VKVLIACESSGVVRSAFRERGHNAWSCDLLPADDGSEFHFQCDFREVTGRDWDFVGYHVDCRVMANSGVRWLTDNPERWKELEAAAEMFNLALRDPRKGYVENSIMHEHAKKLIAWDKSQIVHPWWFGDPYFKSTCLWLRGGLDNLWPTKKLTPPAPNTEEWKKWNMVHRATPGPLRWKIRSRTFPGVAAAMADQWGTNHPCLLL